MKNHLYTAEVCWTLDGEFPRGKYSRKHVWRFDGGIDVPASASHLVVPLPWSDKAAVDPEEALIASISSCHMLTFLDIARRAKHSIVSYTDKAEGIMEEIAPKRMAVTRVTLNPEIVFEDQLPSREELDALHHEAHEICFIANSVKCEITVAPDIVRLVSVEPQARV
ncbi:OsmC family protein [Roseibium sediminis]|uniref:OsmC family protein n=1 Tax=Roseibium sediminis TaxID=1775174 RepID=UPI00123DD51F|nr:OsmC family protein [Roseibium sediminis]